MKKGKFQITKEKIYSFIAILLIVCMITPANIGKVSARETKVFGNFTSVDLKYGDKTGGNVDNDDKMSVKEKITVEYTFEVAPDEPMDPNITYTFKVPDCITVPIGQEKDIEVKMDDGTTQKVGSVRYGEGNVGYIDFIEVTQLLKQTGYIGKIWIENTKFDNKKIKNDAQNEIIFNYLNVQKTYVLYFYPTEYKASVGVDNQGNVVPDKQDYADWNVEMIPELDEGIEAISNILITDEIDENHTYVPHSAKVYILDVNNKVISTISDKLDTTGEIQGFKIDGKNIIYSHEQLKAGLKIKLSFQTKLNDDLKRVGNVTIKTYASARFQYKSTLVPGMEKVETAFIERKEAYVKFEFLNVDKCLSKSGGSPIKGEHSIPWSINIKNYKFNTLVLSDTLTEGKTKYDKTSFKIIDITKDNSNKIDQEQIEFSNDDRTFKINILDLVEPEDEEEEYEITYNTILQDPNDWATNVEQGKQFSNTATITINDKTASKTASKLYKSNMIKIDTLGYDYSKRQQEWEVTVNDNAVTIEEPTITIRVPKDQEISQEYLEELVKGKNWTYYIEDRDINGIQKVIIKLGKTLSKRLRFVFKTTVIDNDKLDKNQQFKVKIDCDLDGGLEDGKQIPGGTSAEAESKDIISILVDKSGKVNDEKTGIDWEILLNRNQITLDNPIWEDVMQKGLIIDDSSIRIYKAKIDKDGKHEKSDEVSESFFDYTISSDNKMTIIFKEKIENAYILEYTTHALEPGEYKNTIALKGYARQEYTSEETCNLTAIDLGGLGYVKLGKLEISKVGKKIDGTKGPISGVVFSLVKKTKKGDRDMGQFTDVNGTVTITNLPYGDYELTEVKAPEGYKLDPTPIKVGINDREVVRVTVENSLSPSTTVPPTPPTSTLPTPTSSTPPTSTLPMPTSATPTSSTPPTSTLPTPTSSTPPTSTLPTQPMSTPPVATTTPTPTLDVPIEVTEEETLSPRISNPPVEKTLPPTHRIVVSHDSPKTGEKTEPVVFVFVFGILVSGGILIVCKKKNII